MRRLNAPPVPAPWWTDRIGWIDGRAEYRQEQRHATVASILDAVQSEGG